jgi:hypothetical protein
VMLVPRLMRLCLRRPQLPFEDARKSALDAATPVVWLDSRLWLGSQTVSIAV